MNAVHIAFKKMVLCHFLSWPYSKVHVCVVYKKSMRVSGFAAIILTKLILLAVANDEDY